MCAKICINVQKWAKNANLCKNVQLFAKKLKNTTKLCKNEQNCAKTLCENPKTLAQLEKISTDGVTSITIFFNLWGFGLTA